jgi:hypothetical protein
MQTGTPLDPASLPRTLAVPGVGRRDLLVTHHGGHGHGGGGVLHEGEHGSRVGP